MKPYIKGALCALLSCCAANAADTAAPAPTMPQQPEEKLYFDMNLVNVSFAYMKDVNNGLSVDDLAGGTLSLGQSFGETSRYYHTWYARTGYLFGKDPYTITEKHEYPAGGGYVDGYRCEQSIIPVIWGYNFHYKWTDHLSSYIGAQLGFHYSRTYKTSNSSMKSPESNGDVWSKTRHTKFAPTFGLEAGASYKFNKRASWNIGINFNTTKDLYKEKQVSVDAEVSKKTAFSATIHTGILITF